jgi:hypothetical protein
MQLSETFAVETELVDDDGMFIDVRGFGVVHIGVFLDKVKIGLYESRSAALPKAETVIPHGTFGGDQTPKLFVRSSNPTNLLESYVSPMRTLETAIGIIDHAQRVYQMDGVTWPRKYELIHDVMQTVPRLRDLGIHLEQAFDKGYFGDQDPKGSLQIVLNMLQDRRNELVRALTKCDQLAASLSEIRHGQG